MLIGELVQKTGFSRDTIRFYEKKGLIQVGRRERRSNNYKEYSEEVLKRLLAIKRIKGFGFTLNETAELLELLELNEASCQNLTSRIKQKVQILDEKIRELENIKKMMLSGLEKCRDKCPPNPSEENCPAVESAMEK